MDNTEKVKLLERRLKRQRIVRRSVLGALGLALLAGSAAIPDKTEYVTAFALSLTAGFFAFILLFYDLMLCRFASTRANGHIISVSRGLIKRAVYVDGEERDEIILFSFSDVLETRLPDGVKVTVTFGRTPFLVAHVSFSDKNPSREL